MKFAEIISELKLLRENVKLEVVVLSSTETESDLRVLIMEDGITAIS